MIVLALLLAVVAPPFYGDTASAADGVNADFPDPSVLVVGTSYYAYGTNIPGLHVPVVASAHLTDWSQPVEALPHPAAWAADVRPQPAAKQVWAPSVFTVRGAFVMFYAVGVLADPRRTCLSVATSRSPLGPFEDTSTGPVVCDSDPLGSIDPQPYVDPRTHLPYLVWKSEGEAGRTPTQLWAQRLDTTGTGLLPGSHRTMLLQTARTWEGPIVENPSMIRYRGRWWLVYSGNRWSSSRYAVGYARCSGPVGPCKRVTSGPLLSSGRTELGPGGAAAFVDRAGRLQIVYHYWQAPCVGYLPTPRCPMGGERRFRTLQLYVDGAHLRAVPFPAR